MDGIIKSAKEVKKMNNGIKKIKKHKRTIDNEKRIRKYMLEWCPDIKDIIFSNPATICILKDGRKGVVKVQSDDRWNTEKGALYAYIKVCKKPKSFFKHMDKELKRASIDLVNDTFKVCLIDDKCYWPETEGQQCGVFDLR